MLHHLINWAINNADSILFAAHTITQGARWIREKATHRKGAKRPDPNSL